jgi:hypothetical protein
MDLKSILPTIFPKQQRYVFILKTTDFGKLESSVPVKKYFYCLKTGIPGSMVCTHILT